MGNKQLDAVNEYAHWVENDTEHKAIWMPVNNGNAPKRIIIADDTLTADSAFRLITQGAHLLWRGDFQNGKQLLQALQRRITKKNERKSNRKRETIDKEAMATVESVIAFIRRFPSSWRRTGRPGPACGFRRTEPGWVGGCRQTASRSCRPGPHR